MKGGWRMKISPEVTQSLPLNKGGFIENPQIWDAHFTDNYAERMNLPLGPVHWKIIQYLRHYYDKHGLAPMFNLIRKELGYSRKELIELFEVKKAMNIFKLAGLPRSLGMV
jgi:dissimilatory sulfite reductase related protein